MAPRGLLLLAVLALQACGALARVQLKSASRAGDVLQRDSAPTGSQLNIRRKVPEQQPTAPASSMLQRVLGRQAAARAEKAAGARGAAVLEDAGSLMQTVVETKVGWPGTSPWPLSGQGKHRRLFGGISFAEQCLRITLLGSGLPQSAT
ncbi:unnamed protein product [Prorocentrum cordatum]|uniref:Uncharacterized protein n=1 Tax=Prorocentrum cordatum TaxID=2364126 RepID=A0ABN9T4B0_9DINO|nr:unnamed protein product [Polarella glacialis]